MVKNAAAAQPDTANPTQVDGTASSSQNHPFDYDKASDSAKREFISKVKKIETRKVTYAENKPIAIIYNPVSGKKTNLVPMI